MSSVSNHTDWFRYIKDIKDLGSEILKRKRKRNPMVTTNQKPINTYTKNKRKKSNYNTKESRHTQRKIAREEERITKE